MFVSHRHFKQAKQSTSALTLLMWSNKSLSSSILHVKNLLRTKKIFHKFVILQMLKRIFHTLLVFITPNLCKLIILQIERRDGHCLLDMPLVFFLHFRINFGGWSCLIFIHNVPMVHRSQPHLQFELPKIEVLFIEFVNGSSTFTLKLSQVTLKDWGYNLYQLI